MIRFFLWDIPTNLLYKGSDNTYYLYFDLTSIFLKGIKSPVDDDNIEFEISEDCIVRMYNQDILIREYHYPNETLICFFEEHNLRLSLKEIEAAKDIIKYSLSKWGQK